jgi:hypothetical protein
MERTEMSMEEATHFCMSVVVFAMRGYQTKKIHL